LKIKLRELQVEKEYTELEIEEKDEQIAKLFNQSLSFHNQLDLTQELICILTIFIYRQE